MVEYGRIHTDGSRSGGQPVLLPCPHCGEQCADLIIDQGDKWAHYSASCLEVRTGYNLRSDAPWRAYAIAAWNKRQPTQSDALAKCLAALDDEEVVHAIDCNKVEQRATWDSALKMCRQRITAALQEQSK